MVASLEDIVKKVEALSPQEQELVATKIEELLEDLEDIEFYQQNKGEPREAFDDVARELVAQGKLPPDWKKA